MHCYFARELLSWCLPVPGDLALLITVGEDVHVLGAHEAASASLKVSRNWADGIGEGREGRKRFRLQRKTQTLPVHPGNGPGQPSPIRGRKLRFPECDQHFTWRERPCRTFM